ncbi:hypothetical protein [Streptomyces sp. NPDC000878]
MTSPTGPEPSNWIQDLIKSPPFPEAVNTLLRRAFKSPELFPEMPVTVIKGEVAALNAAVNAVKLEFNAFDPIKILGIQDRYDEMIQNVFRSKERKEEVRAQKPENLLAEIKGIKTRLAVVEKDLKGPPPISQMRGSIKAKADRDWATRKFNALEGSKNPRKDLPKTKGSAGPVPSTRQLQQQERQLRATIASFVRLVKGATPELASLSREINKIERELKK